MTRITVIPLLNQVQQTRNPLSSEEIAGQARNDESAQIRVIRVICVQKDF